MRLFICAPLRRAFASSASPSGLTATATNLTGKTALITGSTSGIGLGIARELARHGAHVIFNGFGQEKDILELRKSFEANGMAGQKFFFSPADMSKEAEIKEMLKEHHNVDILVNNAGIQHVEKVETFSAKNWERILSINLSSALYTTQAVLPFMRKQGWGRIINIASVHGIVASVEKSAYVASKHGLIGFTKVLALETAGSGVTANCICPGWVLTPLVKAQIDANVIKSEGKLTFEQCKDALVAAKQPSRQFVTPEELGQVAVFFCSPAAKQITGVALPVDGGWTAQ